MNISFIYFFTEKILGGGEDTPANVSCPPGVNIPRAVVKIPQGECKLPRGQDKLVHRYKMRIGLATRSLKSISSRKPVIRRTTRYRRRVRLATSSLNPMTERITQHNA